MAALYITEQKAIIRKTSDRLVVEKNKTVLMEIPCLKLDTVLIYGNVQVTTQALAEMLDHGIELALFSLSGRLRGQLTPPKAKNIVLRMRQYEVSRSEGFCLRLAREIVQAKIRNSGAVLQSCLGIVDPSSSRKEKLGDAVDGDADAVGRNCPDLYGGIATLMSHGKLSRKLKSELP